MKTARFSDLIAKCGRPEVYLHLLPFAKDAKLKRADKQRRLVTVFQTLRGNQTDHAELGFHEGGSHQYLIFPKSAAAFADKKIVGIKYELIEPDAPAKRQPAPKPKPPRGPRAKPPKKPPAERIPPKAAGKILPFAEETESEPEGDDEEGDLRSGVRRALKLLEDGKAVAAYNLLKRLV